LLLSVHATPNAAGSSGPTVVRPRSYAELQEADRRLDRMRDTGDLRASRVRADTMLEGRSHERFQQYYKGVRVFGADITRQIDRNGAVVSAFGSLYPAIDIDVSPTVSEVDALARVRFELGDASIGASSTELVVLPLPGSFALAWRLTVSGADVHEDVFVDAHSGAILKSLSNRRDAAAVGHGTGVLGDDKKVSDDGVSSGFLARDLLRPPEIVTFDMRGNLPRVKAFLRGAVGLTEADVAATGSSNVWTDPAVVDGHAYAGIVYDYYFKRFGRRGLDDQNLAIVSLIHPASRADLPTAAPSDIFSYYLNAEWFTDRKVMLYGEGLPPGYVTVPDHQYWNYTSGGLDIVGHELTHGVTQFTSDLIYENESGALNESFSDIMGTSVEFFYRTGPGSGLGKPDYLIGADVVRGPLNGIRSMADPHLFGQPDHYSRLFRGTGDNGGVHINSGISNNAFFLAIEGGTNRTSGVAVQGVGGSNRDQIERVFYRAFAFLMPAGASFSVARAATIQAARDLYGAGSAAERAVTQAWNAVGVQ
jgi:thermolysin